MVDVNRTFSELPRNDQLNIEDYDDWFRALSPTAGLPWSKLLTKRVVVILGEPGIGKTFEFDQQVKRLQKDNKPAFFLPLNEINSDQDVERALKTGGKLYEQWKSDGSDNGYFFLDSVDEARLNSPTALKAALRFFVDALQPHLKRVRFYFKSYH